MSTYIDVAHPNRHAPYTDIPDLVMDYLHYLDVVKLRSPRTINGYYLDLRGFFRYMMMVWNLAQPDTPLEEIDLTHITKRQISTITKRDIINYLDYARSNDNGAKARARKLSALRGFFGYLCHQINELSENPTDNINLGSPKKSLPKYLSASESIRLLKNIQSDFYERDYCIIVFFLNCGMRLAELITINLGDFKDDTIKITGKGNKERLVYLNTACQAALEHYRRYTHVSGRCGYAGHQGNPGARECIHDADLYPYQPAAVETGGGSLSPCRYWLYCTAVQSDDGFKAGHWRRGQLNQKT